jgi:hypothetical protein
VSGQGGPWRARWAAVLGAVLVLSLVACGGGDEEEATPPPSIAEPTTVAADPYAVPPVIDAAYVNRVLEAIDAGVGEVVRIVYRTRDLPPEVFDRLKALYLERETINTLLIGLQDDMRLGFPGYRQNPGNTKSRVDALLNSSPSCIFVRVTRDYSQVGTNSEPSVEWIGLKPRDPTRAPNHYNPTPWMVALEGFQRDGSQPPNPCTP